MMLTKPPVNTAHQSPNKGGYAGKRRVEGICWHVTVGSAQSSLGWLCNPASNASSNYLIARDGTIYELVSPDEDAWANGAVNRPDMTNPLIRDWVTSGRNPNTRTVSIENERSQSANDVSGGFTEAQQDALVTLSAWLCQRYGLVADRTHIFGHRSIDSMNRKYCPGISEAEWDSWVAEIAALVGDAAPAHGGTVQEPKAGVALGYINARGEAIYVWNAGGQAVAVEGVDAQDLGMTVRNDQQERFSVSLQKNVQQPWVKVG